ncbi:myosin-3 [Aspergillus niger]|uniref:Myosin-3 n=1 Tax=Aspergillus niger TaxID=5061 RepID=A0A9W6A273_ASPNG|nr:myosin-3 [Aspergillus niger]
MAPGSQNSRSKDKSDKADKSERAGKSYSSAIEDLKTSAAAVLQHLETLDTVENLQRQIKELTNQLAAANKKVEEAQEEKKQEESTRQRIIKDFGNRVLELKEKEDKLEVELKEQRKKAESSSRKKDQERDAQLEKYKTRLRKVEEELDCEKTRNTELELRLRRKQKTLEDLRGDFQIIPLEQDVFESFKHLESSLYELTERYFKDFLYSSDRVPHPFRHASHLMFLSYTDHRPVPRARTAQFCIAGRLASHVFQPLCIGSPRGTTSMGDALQKSEKIQPRQKAILRSLLFTAFETDEERVQSDLIQSVASELFDELKGILSTDNDNAFSKELLSYLETAARVWNKSKRVSEWILTSSDLHINPQQWKMIKGDSNKAVAAQEPANSGMVIFPQIYIDGNDSKYYPGTLWSFDSGPVEEKRTAQSPHTRRASASRSSKSPTVAEASSDSGVPASRSLASRDRVSEMGRKVFSDSEGQRRCKSTC